MEVNLSIRPIKELNSTDKKIADDIRLEIGQNKAFRLNIEYKQNKSGQKQMIYTLYGDEDHKEYNKQKIEQVQQKINKVTKGGYVSLNDSPNIFSFCLKHDGYINAKNNYWSNWIVIDSFILKQSKNIFG